MDRATDMRSRGFAPQEWTDPPGHRWSGLCDPRDELVIVLDGRLRIWLVDQPYDLGPGDELLIPGGVIHGSLALGETPVHLLFGYRDSPLHEDPPPVLPRSPVLP